MRRARCTDCETIFYYATVEKPAHCADCAPKGEAPEAKTEEPQRRPRKDEKTNARTR